MAMPTSARDDFQGVLWKRRDLFKNRWRPRWFVLHAQAGVLTYYLHDSNSSVHYDVVPRGTIYLRSCEVEINDHLTRERESLYAFTITPPTADKVPCFLAAASERERRDWIERLSQVCRNDSDDDEEESLDASAAAPAAPIQSVDLQSTLMQHRRESWQDASKEEKDQVLAGVPASLATRIQSVLEANLPLCCEFKPEHGWKTMFENRKGVTAYERKADASGRTMVKSTAVLNHPPKQILSLLVDICQRRDFEVNVVNDARLLRFNPHVFLDYYAYRPVWPTQARDFVAAVHWRVLEKKDMEASRDSVVDCDKAICVMGFSWADEQSKRLKPPVKNHVRGNLIVSLYLLEQITNTGTSAVKTRVTRVLSYDLGGNVPRSLTKTIMQQQAMMPSVIEQHLSQADGKGSERSQSSRSGSSLQLASAFSGLSQEALTPTALAQNLMQRVESGTERFLGVIESNAQCVRDVIDFKTESPAEEDANDSRRETTTRGDSLVIERTKELPDEIITGPSILTIAVHFLNPIIVWVVSSILNIRGKELFFVSAMLYAIRFVILAHLGPEYSFDRRREGSVGNVTCRFKVDMKGVTRFINNAREEQELENAERSVKVSVVHIVVKAMAQAISEVEFFSCKRVQLPFLGIDGYYFPRRKLGADVSVMPYSLVSSARSRSDPITVRNASNMSIQAIADFLEDKPDRSFLEDSSLLSRLAQLFLPPSWNDSLAPCLVVSIPDSNFSEVDLDVAPSPTHSGVEIVAAVGGVPPKMENPCSSRNNEDGFKPELRISLTIDCPVCDVAKSRMFAEKVQKLIQFPEMCED